LTGVGGIRAPRMPADVPSRACGTGRHGALFRVESQFSKAPELDIANLGQSAMLQILIKFDSSIDLIPRFFY
jgi:hypothetical protein